ncbi:response regulatory domain-containing protein, partial [Haematococcus lacustris]
LRVLALTSEPARLEQQLRQCNYNTTFFHSCKDAARALEESPDTFDIAICDASFVTAVRQGAEQARLLKQLKQLPFILAADAPKPAEVMLGIKLGAAEVLEKPLCPLKLKTLWQHTVRRMMRSSSAKSSSIPITSSLLKAQRPGSSRSSSESCHQGDNGSGSGGQPGVNQALLLDVGEALLLPSPRSTLSPCTPPVLESMASLSCDGGQSSGLPLDAAWTSLLLPVPQFSDSLQLTPGPLPRQPTLLTTYPLPRAEPAGELQLGLEPELLTPGTSSLGVLGDLVTQQPPTAGFHQTSLDSPHHSNLWAKAGPACPAADPCSSPSSSRPSHLVDSSAVGAVAAGCRSELLCPTPAPGASGPPPATPLVYPAASVDCSLPMCDLPLAAPLPWNACLPGPSWVGCSPALGSMGPALVTPDCAPGLPSYSCPGTSLPAGMAWGLPMSAMAVAPGITPPIFPEPTIPVPPIHMGCMLPPTHPPATPPWAGLGSGLPPLPIAAGLPWLLPCGGMNTSMGMSMGVGMLDATAAAFPHANLSVGSAAAPLPALPLHMLADACGSGCSREGPGGSKPAKLPGSLTQLAPNNGAMAMSASVRDLLALDMEDMDLLEQSLVEQELPQLPRCESALLLPSLEDLIQDSDMEDGGLGYGLAQLLEADQAGVLPPLAGDVTEGLDRTFATPSPLQPSVGHVPQRCRPGRMVVASVLDRRQ